MAGSSAYADRSAVALLGCAVAGRTGPWGKRGLYFSPSGAPANDSYYYSQEKLEDGWFVWHYGGW
jgi:hypothetical protein